MFPTTSLPKLATFIVLIRVPILTEPICKVDKFPKLKLAAVKFPVTSKLVKEPFVVAIEELKLIQPFKIETLFEPDKLSCILFDNEFKQVFKFVILDIVRELSGIDNDEDMNEDLFISHEFKVDELRTPEQLAPPRHLNLFITFILSVWELISVFPPLVWVKEYEVFKKKFLWEKTADVPNVPIFIVLAINVLVDISFSTLKLDTFNLVDKLFL